METHRQDLNSARYRKILAVRDATRILRRDAPALFPVRVRMQRLPKNLFGDCTLIGSDPHKYFKVRLNSLHCLEIQLWTIVHEWAHALAWHEGEEVHDHGPEWGVSLARCWRLVFDYEGA